MRRGGTHDFARPRIRESLIGAAVEVMEEESGLNMGAESPQRWVRNCRRPTYEEVREVKALEGVATRTLLLYRTCP